MRISQFRYSQIEKSVQDKKLMLSFDDDDKDEILFISPKITVSKMVSLTDSKLMSKNRTGSTAMNKQFSSTENNVSNLLNSYAPVRPSTASSIRKSQKSLNDQHPLRSRPRTATNRFLTNLQQKKVIKYDIFQQLSIQIKEYLGSIFTQEEKKQTLQELKLIMNILQKQPDQSAIFLQFQKLQGHLSKFLRHRISHLYFYLIYSKFYSCFSKQSLDKEIKLLSLAEYHARSFNFRKVAFLICLDLQQKYIKMGNFEQSRKYAIKSLKLAVLINDRYEQIKMLEYIGVVRFYQGTLNNRGTNMLTQQQRLDILKHYRQQQEMPKIFNFLDKNSTTSKRQNKENNNFSQQQQPLSSFLNQSRVYFNQGQNFIYNNIPGENLKKFNKNFHGINKKINRNNPVKQTIKKIYKVGQVKKFIGKDNYITLYPQGNTIKSRNQIQVLVTHKKYTQLEKNKPFFRKQLPLIMKNLQSLILTETYRCQLSQNDEDQSSR